MFFLQADKFKDINVLTDAIAIELFAQKKEQDATEERQRLVSLGLEEDIANNEKEASRLRDENIKSYQMTHEAEKRLQVAIEAEQRAASEIAKLETLKQEIHSSITKEK